ncbi:tetraspanin-32 isoform X3 [Bos mutus]|uniref:tetraspanin-32 isoform X3 n=1 Tax=Bos mutus TaxID=72004 RepID=UPI0038B69A06
MEPCSRVRVAKCQMLATSLFVLLLSSAMAATAALSYFGPHFTVIGPVSADRTTYEALHHWAFSAGIALAALLTLGAMLSAAATVRGAGGLMAAAFLSFALVFCALVQAAFWRAHSPTQMEDAVLDAYDRAYERALRSTSGSGRQELVAIQDTFLCCGKSSPLGLLGGLEADLCQGEEAARQEQTHPISGKRLLATLQETDRRMQMAGSPALTEPAQCPGPWRWGGGLPAGDPELPEGAREHRLHPDRPGPRLHGPATTLPRNPESTDASGRDPRLRTRPKQMFLGAV